MYDRFTSPNESKKPYTVSKFEVGRRSLTSEYLLEDFIKHLSERRVNIRGALLTGVVGTKRLLIERTHGPRYYTFAVPLTSLIADVENGNDILHDPFVYASDATRISPAIAVYDLSAFGDPTLGVKRYIDQRGHEPDSDVLHIMPAGMLDQATRHVALIKES